MVRDWERTEAELGRRLALPIGAQIDEIKVGELSLANRKKRTFRGPQESSPAPCRFSFARNLPRNLEREFGYFKNLNKKRSLLKN